MKIGLILLLFPWYLNGQEKFWRCDSSRMAYHFHKGHGKERYKIESKLVKEIIKQKYTPQKDSSNTGILTLQFMVNCKGEVGQFNIIQCDYNYNPIQFNSRLIHSFTKIIQELNVFKHIILKNKEGVEINYDYLSYLTFKLKNGEIIDILP